jgi:hypothetical protein
MFSKDERRNIPNNNPQAPTWSTDFREKPTAAKLAKKVYFCTELAVSFHVYSRQSTDSTISQYITPHCGTQTMIYISQVYYHVLLGLSIIIVPSNFNIFHTLLSSNACCTSRPSHLP